MSPDSGMKRRVRAGKYGSSRHRILRANWAPSVAAGLVDCSLCGERILPGSTWHLAHDDADPTGQAYKGPAHRTCNVRDAAAKMNGTTKGRSRLW